MDKEGLALRMIGNGGVGIVGLQGPALRLVGHGGVGIIGQGGTGFTDSWSRRGRDNWTRRDRLYG